MVDYQHKQIVVVGAGLTGLSCVDYLLARGAELCVMDTRPQSVIQVSLPQQVSTHFGGLETSQLLQADLIVVSPGIALATAELQQAAQAGIEIVGDIELFCREVKAPIVAITGSNGKSTVATLVYEMAKTAGWKVGLGGNIGVPALTLLEGDHQLIVLELSSFQLETTHYLPAVAATILNVSEDHMDRYPAGVSQYQRAKRGIYTHAKTCVINADDSLTFPVTENTPCVSFGILQGTYHLSEQHGSLWLTRKGKPILNTQAMRLVGQHNYLNALAALALADSVGIPSSASIEALKVFAGLPHRFQMVWENQGVRWINDSKSTNVGSTLAALRSLGEHKQTLHLLLGGEGKSADFAPLATYLAQENVKTYAFGRDRASLAALSPRTTLQQETLEEVIRCVVKRLQPGDMVLLSPACASWDQFRDFAHRGEEFIRLAQELG